MDVVFGLDISHYQDRALDLKRVAREGLRFVFLKAGEGGNYVDPEFASNLAEARAAGLLVGAYWFIRQNASPAQHVAKIRQVVPHDVVLIPDVEVASDKTWPTRSHATGCLGAIKAAGYRVPLSYIPLWFWRDYWHSPTLIGWPPLWSSRYPDNVVGTLAAEWDDVPTRFWDGYGGLPVAVLQFTSSARIAGHQPLDANAFRGTLQQLAGLFGDTAPTAPKEDDDMQPTDTVRDPGPNRWGHTWLNTNQVVNNGAHGLVAISRKLDAYAAVAAADKSVTAEQLQGMVDDAIARGNEETRAYLADIVRDAVTEEFDDAAADRVLARLAGKLTAATDGA